LPQAIVIDEGEINGAPGLLVKAGGRTIVAISIDTDGSRITAIFGMANPDKLAAAPQA